MMPLVYSFFGALVGGVITLLVCAVIGLAAQVEAAKAPK